MKFSIITINFNNSSGLESTIKSVKAQNLIDFQFIVIDGGSSDNSVKVINKNLDIIDYWISEKDNGVYHAMNKGLKEAIGDYCIFLNSGDYFFDTQVLKKVSDSIYINSSLVYGLIEWEGKSLFWNPPGDLKDFEMAFQSLIPHQACFFKTDVIKGLGGYKEEFKVISDWGLMMEILNNKYPTQKMDLIIIKFLELIKILVFRIFNEDIENYLQNIILINIKIYQIKKENQKNYNIN